MIKVAKSSVETLRGMIASDVFYKDRELVFYETNSNGKFDRRITVWVGGSTTNDDLSRLWVITTDGEHRKNTYICGLRKLMSDRALGAALILAWELTH